MTHESNSTPTCTSPKHGTGEIYHCAELDCPIHGERNRILAGVPKRVFMGEEGSLIAGMKASEKQLLDRRSQWFADNVVKPAVEQMTAQPVEDVLWEYNKFPGDDTATCQQVNSDDDSEEVLGAETPFESATREQREKEEAAGINHFDEAAGFDYMRSHTREDEQRHPFDVSQPTTVGVDASSKRATTATTSSVSEEPEARDLSGDQPAAFRIIIDLIRSGRRRITLTGGAGTGKTYLVARIAAWASRHGYAVTVTAPTHKAVGVLAEKMADYGVEVEASTTHSLLGLLLMPDYENDSGGHILRAMPKKEEPINSLTDTLVIVDEASMVGSVLKRHIDEHPAGIQWLFVGDLAQLPPVGENSSELLDEPDATLNTVLRQAAHSEIIQLATRIRTQHDLSMLYYPGSDVIQLDSEEDMLQAALERFQSDAHKADPSHARILVYRNARREAINYSVRHLIINDDLPFVENEWLVMYAPFRPEESRVEQLAGIAKQYRKGESGYGSAWRRFFEAKEALQDGEVSITSLHTSQEVQVIDAFEDVIPFGSDVRFQVWRLHVRTKQNNISEVPILKPEDRVIQQRMMLSEAANAKNIRQQMDDLEAQGFGKGTIPWDQLDQQRRRHWGTYFSLEKLFAQVDYTYCSTTHKAQGSTFEHVLLDVPDLMAATSMLERILYTAVTRPAKSLTFYL